MRITGTITLDLEIDCDDEPGQVSLATADLSQLVMLDAGAWIATLVSAEATSFSAGFTLGAGTSQIEARRDRKFDHQFGWTAAPGNLGVRVEAERFAVSVAEFEAAIDASGFVRVATPHAVPTAKLDVEGLDGIDVSGAFA